MTAAALVLFRVGDRACALPADRVEGVLHLPELARPPASPPLLEGFLLRPTGPVPVVRSAALLGLAAGAVGLYTPLVVVAGEAGPVALLVDAVDAVVRADPTELSSVAADATLNGCVAAEWPRPGGTVHVLDPDRILLRQEAERLGQLAGQLEQRLDDLPGAAP